MTGDKAIPSYSASGLAARDIFYESYNDFNFYVEDEDQENLYHRLLVRLFPKLRIDQIFPLKGKLAVLGHAQDPANRMSQPKSVYIVDKDLDDLLGTQVVHPSVYYLPVNCVENLLVCKGAALGLAVEGEPKCSRAELSAKLDFDAFMQAAQDALEPLFRCFVVALRSQLEIKTTGQSVENFTRKTSRAIVETSLVIGYCAKAQALAVAAGIDKTKFEREMKKAFLRKSRSRHISGKFTLTLLLHHLRATLKLGNISLDQFRYRLSAYARLAQLEGLKLLVRKKLAASLAKSSRAAESK